MTWQHHLWLYLRLHDIMYMRHCQTLGHIANLKMLTTKPELEIASERKEMATRLKRLLNYICIHAWHAYGLVDIVDIDRHLELKNVAHELETASERKDMETWLQRLPAIFSSTLDLHMALTTMTDIANSNKVGHELEIACKRKEMSTRQQWLLVTLWSTFDLHRTLSRLFDTDRHRELKNVTHETRTRHSIWTERDNKRDTNCYTLPFSTTFDLRMTPPSLSDIGWHRKLQKVTHETRIRNNVWTVRVMAMRLQRLLATFSTTLDLHVGCRHCWTLTDIANSKYRPRNRNSK